MRNSICIVISFMFVFTLFLFYFILIATFGEVLAKYHIVSKLLALLLHENLDSAEKFSIILTLGHCTETCGNTGFT